MDPLTETMLYVRERMDKMQDELAYAIPQLVRNRPIAEDVKDRLNTVKALIAEIEIEVDLG